MSTGSISRLLISSFFLFLIILIERENDAVYSLYDINVFLPVYLIALIVFVVVIVIDIKEFFKIRKLYPLIPTLSGLVLITISLFIHYYHDYKINRPVLISASCECDQEKDLGEEHCFFAHLKKDGSYLISDIILANQYLYYGSYKWKDSFIILDRSKVGNNIFSDRLVFRNMFDTSSNSKKLYLTQIDNKGKEIDSDRRLFVDYLPNKLEAILNDNLYSK